MAEVTGLRQETCPWWALRDPYVQRVVAAHRWWKVGELSTRWPDPPFALLRGIEIYDAALSAVMNDEMERSREENAPDAPRPGGASAVPKRSGRRRPPPARR